MAATAAFPSSEQQQQQQQQQNVVVEYRKNLISEILPGLWIGEIGAVNQIRKIPRRWTVISVLKTYRLSTVRRTLRDMEMSCYCERYTASLDRHVEWDMADQHQANFLSPRLIEILDCIDDALSSSSSDPGAGEETESSAAGASAVLPPKACLVHCAAGKSRSSAVCAAWLLSRRQCDTLADALDCIRQVRPIICPNMGFLAGLRALEQTNGDLEAAMERMRGRVRTCSHEE